jgi:cell division protein ZapA
MSHEPVNAQIMGQSYVLSAPSEEVADLRAAVSRVDEAMCRIRDAGKVKARERIAVLAALNIAFDAEQAQAKVHAQMITSQVPSSPEASDQAPHQADQPHPSADLQDDDYRLATLIYKLDQALGRDGRLL